MRYERISTTVASQVSLNNNGGVDYIRVLCEIGRVTCDNLTEKSQYNITNLCNYVMNFVSQHSDKPINQQRLCAAFEVIHAAAGNTVPHSSVRRFVVVYCGFKQYNTIEEVAVVNNQICGKRSVLYINRSHHVLLFARDDNILPYSSSNWLFGLPLHNQADEQHER